MRDMSELLQDIRGIDDMHSPVSLSMRRSARLELAAGRCRTVRRGLRVRISCLRGCVWATEEGDRRDILLTPGQTWTSTGRGKVVLQGIPAAMVEVAGITPARWVWLKRWMKKMKPAGDSDGCRYKSRRIASH